MRNINIDDLKPGMVVAESIRDRNGRMLLGEGTELTPKHIRICKAWGITEAIIEGESEEGGKPGFVNTTDPKSYEIANDYMLKRFMFNDQENETVKELYRLATIRKAIDIYNDPSLIAKLKPEPVPDMELSDFNIDRNALMQKKINLPVMPSIFHQIIEVINDPRCSGKDIADVVGKDTSLSAKLLKMANSAFYSLRTKVDTLTSAVAVIGTNQIGSLAMGLTVASFFKGIPNDLLDMESFWKHSLSCGLIARFIATHKRISNSERVFVGGLLHDIGRLVLYNYHAEPSRYALMLSKKGDARLYDTEYAIFGFRHATIGKVLLKKWKLPLSLENIVAYHHNPFASNDPLEPAIVQLSDIIAHALDLGTSGEGFVPPLHLKTWEYLGLQKSIFTAIAKQLDRQLSEIMRFFIKE